MTDLFTRLAARQLGTVRLLTPQVPGLFEPQGAADDGFVEEVGTQDAVAPSVAEKAENAAPAQAPVRAPDPVAPETSRQAPVALPEQDIESLKHETRIEHQLRHDHTETSHERITETHLVTQEVKTQTREEPIQDAPEIPSDVLETVAEPPTDVSVSQPAPEQVTPLTDTPQAGDPILPPPVVEAIPQVAPQMPMPQPPERRVDVHIGHLEIRAAPPPARKMRVSRKAENPAPDLNSYLGGRR